MSLGGSIWLEIDGEDKRRKDLIFLREDEKIKMFNRVHFLLLYFRDLEAGREKNIKIIKNL